MVVEGAVDVASRRCRCHRKTRGEFLLDVGEEPLRQEGAVLAEEERGSPFVAGGRATGKLEHRGVVPARGEARPAGCAKEGDHADKGT
jgi:hypothetical protein